MKIFFRYNWSLPSRRCWFFFPSLVCSSFLFTNGSNDRVVVKQDKASSSRCIIVCFNHRDFGKGWYSWSVICIFVAFLGFCLRLKLSNYQSSINLFVFLFLHWQLHFEFKPIQASDQNFYRRRLNLLTLKCHKNLSTGAQFRIKVEWKLTGIQLRSARRTVSSWFFDSLCDSYFTDTHDFVSIELWEPTWDQLDWLLIITKLFINCLIWCGVEMLKITFKSFV